MEQRSPYNIPREPLDDRERYLDEPEYGENLLREYGSIIKDLTDTDDMLLKFELRLLGKGENKDGEIITIRKPYMTAEKARDLIDQIRSIVNQNTHFTKFDKHNVEAILTIAASEIPRWLMRQGNDVPRKHRSTINFIAFNLIIESLYKANDGTILRWTKGSFREGIMQNERNKKSGWFDWLPGRK